MDTTLGVFWSVGLCNFGSLNLKIVKFNVLPFKETRVMKRVSFSIIIVHKNTDVWWQVLLKYYIVFDLHGWVLLKVYSYMYPGWTVVTVTAGGVEYMNKQRWTQCIKSATGDFKCYTQQLCSSLEHHN